MVVTPHSRRRPSLPPRALTRSSQAARPARRCPAPCEPARSPHYCDAVRPCRGPGTGSTETAMIRSTHHHRPPQPAAARTRLAGLASTSTPTAAHDDQPCADAPHFREWAREGWSGRVRCAEVDRLLLRQPTHASFGSISARDEWPSGKRGGPVLHSYCKMHTIVFLFIFNKFCLIIN